MPIYECILNIRIIKNGKLIEPELSYVISGLCFRVHNELGRFSREKQYGDLLEQELKKENVRYMREYTVGESGNKIDFMIEDKVIIELKAKDVLTREDYYQTQRYLQILGKKLGLLVNFRDRYIKPRRVVKIDTDARTKFTN